MNRLAAEGVSGWLVGDTRQVDFDPPAGWRVIGKSVDIRRVYALAAMADVVIGTESAIVNAVAHEPPLKIVMLSHSAPENLTRDWDRTIALQPKGLACYPCHRIHQDWGWCTRATETGTSACQSSYTAETVAGYALQWIRGEMKEAA
jgi:hypothetical protein